MFKKLSLLILGLFVLGILSPVSSFAQSDMKITRIQGKDRYKTAVEQPLCVSRGDRHAHLRIHILAHGIGIQCHVDLNISSDTKVYWKHR